MSNLQQFINLQPSAIRYTSVMSARRTVSGSGPICSWMAEGVVMDDQCLPSADVHSVGICVLFLLNLRNMLIRKPQGFTWIHFLDIMLLAILLLPYYIYYGEIPRISLCYFQERFLIYFYLLLFLLRYNSYSHKVTFLDDAVQWLLVYSQSYTTLITNTRLFHYLKKKFHGII